MHVAYVRDRVIKHDSRLLISDVWRLYTGQHRRPQFLKAATDSHTSVTRVHDLDRLNTTCSFGQSRSVWPDARTNKRNKNTKSL